MKKCNTCGENIHPKRLEILPSSSQCVSCSTTGKKAGITVVIGEGDHTCNDVIILDREDYNQYQELEYKIYGRRKDDLPYPDEEEIDDDFDDNEDEVIEIIEEVKHIDLKDLED